MVRAANYFDCGQYNQRYGTELDKYEAMIHTLVNGGVYPHCARPWREHVADYIKRDICLVKYEDLSAQPLETLSQIMAFVGVFRSAEELERVIGEQSFNTVKKRAIAEGNVRNMNFLRKGRPSAYLEELTPEQCQRIVTGSAPLIEQLGYVS
jgi:hypothetical protein